MQLIALQLATRWEDRLANHARVSALLAELHTAPGAMLVLPEMFDTGFSMNTAATDPGADSVTERFCREIAVTKQVTVVAGLVARTGDGRLANEAVIFTADGTIASRYRKLQPFSPSGEHQHYAAGDEVQVVDWQRVRVSPFICYDLRFPEHFRTAARRGAELLLVLANWPAIRADHWTTLLRARAIENQAYVLGVNRCGTDPHAAYNGQSCLFDPTGREIFHADDREQLLIADIDVNIVRDWRAAFPPLRDMKS